jgi:hypothetical protein
MRDGQSDGDGRWMTKREIAAVRGISIASADRLVRRHGWRKQPGNDGRVRTYVPSDWAEPKSADPPDIRSDGQSDIPSDISRQGEGFLVGPSDIRSDVPSDISIITKAFDAAIASLTERARAAERRAEQAEARVNQLEIERAVDAAARRSWLFRPWRR